MFSPSQLVSDDNCQLMFQLSGTTTGLVSLLLLRPGSAGPGPRIYNGLITGPQELPFQMQIAKVWSDGGGRERICIFGGATLISPE